MSQYRAGLETSYSTVKPQKPEFKILQRSKNNIWLNKI
jgi:hypothetical protein